MYDRDTIVALATPLGKGGIGVVRVSGPIVEVITNNLTGRVPKERVATFTEFMDSKGSPIDQGLALFFRSPRSFTGEDVLEIQGHGGPIVMNLIVERVRELGARLARPGEFSERAFFNDKIDLSQAEAIADLIDSASNQAAMSAMRSLSGEFSKKIYRITESLIELRVFIEAAIDFPEEEIDFLDDPRIGNGLEELIEEITDLKLKANQGALLREGISIVFAGRPNAGKSSLMNRFTGTDTSIVTEIAGTTRDVIDEHVHLDGVPIRLIDTAGLREGDDPIEIEGVRRAVREIDQADYVLVVVDLDSHREDLKDHVELLLQEIPQNASYLVVLNKADIWQPEAVDLGREYILTSALTGLGIDTLKDRLKEGIGYSSGMEGCFIARSRHLEALQRGLEAVLKGKALYSDNKAGELLAEELHHGQQALGEITGEFTSDDLLGRIFSTFCIGK